MTQPDVIASSAWDAHRRQERAERDSHVADELHRVERLAEALADAAGQPGL